MADGPVQIARHAHASLAVLRVMSALVLMQHGMQKLFLYPPSEHHPDPVPLFSLFGIGGVMEFFGGLLLAVGLFTRPVAFLLSGLMAVAYWMFHFASGLQMPNGLFPVVNGGDLAIVLCFVFLHFAVVGGGRWSGDALIAQRNRPA